MVPKCIVLFLVIVAVQSATLQGRNIPVEVRYERLDHEIASNLGEKIQLSEEESKESHLRLQKLSISEEDLAPTSNHNNFIRNFDAKVQLSPEELLQSSKHLPVSHDVQENEYYGTDEKLGELRTNPTADSKPDGKNRVIIQRAQDIVEKGLENLRNNFQPTENEVSPSKEEWEKLDTQVKEYFVKETNILGSRQDQITQPQNIFQNIANGIQQVTNNFVQQFQGQNQNTQPGQSGDEGQAQAPQQQGPVQGFVGYFTGGVQNIVSTIQNIGQSGQQASGGSTTLGDDSNQQQTGFIGNIVSNVQQFFQGPGGNQGIVGNGTQGDTPPPSGGGVQQGFFAGAINQFNQVVSNIIPTAPQTPPPAQGDEGANKPPSNQPAGPFQQVVQSFGNIGTAFNQFIQGGQPQNKPPGSEDENANNPPQNQNFVQSIGQNIGNAIQSIQNQFVPPVPAGQKPGESGSTSGSSNPIAGQVSNIGNQLQQIAGQQAGSNPIQNLIPGSSSSGKQPIEEQPAASTVTEQTGDIEKETVDPEKKEEVMTATE